MMQRFKMFFSKNRSVSREEEEEIWFTLSPAGGHRCGVCEEEEEVGIECHALQ